MAIKKTTIKKEEVIETVKEETPKVEINSEFAKLLEIYKVQNPVKYELKKEELLKKLNK